jgi:hypothetical protein
VDFYDETYILCYVPTSVLCKRSFFFLKQELQWTEITLHSCIPNTKIHRTPLSRLDTISPLHVHLMHFMQRTQEDKDQTDEITKYHVT